MLQEHVYQEEVPQALAGRIGQAERPKVVFVLGGPGAGKGTQCERLADEFGFVHLSAGDLLRAERDSGSPDGEMIESYIREGKIVPVEVTIRLLEKAMRASGRSRFLIDGFPRNENNLEGWMQLMNEKVDVEFVLFYDVDDKVRLQRLTERSKTSGRSDDNEETIRKRFHVFEEQTMPVVNWYARQGKVRVIDASPDKDTVFQKTQKVMLPVIVDELLLVTQRLLDAVVQGDFDTYKALCVHDLSAIEDETQGMVVEGLEFHKFYMDLARERGGKVPVKNYILHPHVRMRGRMAVMAYTRLIQVRNERAEEGGEREELTSASFFRLCSHRRRRRLGQVLSRRHASGWTTLATGGTCISTVHRSGRARALEVQCPMIGRNF